MFKHFAAHKALQKLQTLIFQKLIRINQEGEKAHVLNLFLRGGLGFPVRSPGGGIIMTCMALETSKTLPSTLTQNSDDADSYT